MEPFERKKKILEYFRMQSKESGKVWALLLSVLQLSKKCL